MNDATTPERLEPEAQTPFQQRARYHLAINGFAFEFPPVPIRQFLRERDVAFDPQTATGPIALDVLRRLNLRRFTPIFFECLVLICDDLRCIQICEHPRET